MKVLLLSWTVKLLTFLWLFFPIPIFPLCRNKLFLSLVRWDEKKKENSVCLIERREMPTREVIWSGGSRPHGPHFHTNGRTITRGHKIWEKIVALVVSSTSKATVDESADYFGYNRRRRFLQGYISVYAHWTRYPSIKRTKKKGQHGQDWTGIF